MLHYSSRFENAKHTRLDLLGVASGRVGDPITSFSHTFFLHSYVLAFSASKMEITFAQMMLLHRIFKV